MPQTREGKRAKYVKRMRARVARSNDRPKRQPTDKEVALAAAAHEKSKRLTELRMKYEPKIVELEVEYADKRREVWADYDERKKLIHQAQLLDRKAS